MIKNIAFELTKQYINGWKDNDINLITSCLLNNCVVIESHGPIYSGISDIKLWFKYWLQAKSRVTRWDVRSFTFCEESATAFCEWDFACVSNEIEYSLSGISLIRFSDKKIALIQEYRMTQPAYQWNKDNLNSE